MDAGRQIGRGAPLLVHDADLQGVFGQAQDGLDRGEEVDGDRHLVRPVHLRLDDIDRAGAAVLEGAPPLQVVNGGRACDQGVQNPFGDFRAVRPLHRVGEHVMADVAHEQEGAPGQNKLAAVWGHVGPVGVQTPGDDPAVLLQVGV